VALDRDVVQGARWRRHLPDVEDPRPLLPSVSFTVAEQGTVYGITNRRAQLVAVP
jgi:hypothetical protein